MSEQTPIERLIEIMRLLRSERGCPWDREQTLETLKEHLIEETYEVIDAIDGGDRKMLCGELGDLLLQVVFQAQIGAEEKSFTFDDVARSISEKLIRRHPHVFGDVKVSGSEEVLKNWEEIKRKEKEGEVRSTVEGIPRRLPALHKAHLVQKRVARVGFDWDDVGGALAKLEEEVGEVKEAVTENNGKKIREEIGDVLFSAVNVCRFFDHNPEDVLEQTIQKFTCRFQAVEDKVHGEGKKITDCSLEELDRYWEEAKTDLSAAD